MKWQKKNDNERRTLADNGSKTRDLFAFFLQGNFHSAAAAEEDMTQVCSAFPFDSEGNLTHHHRHRQRV